MSCGESIDASRCPCKEGSRLEERAGEGGGHHCQRVHRPHPQPPVGHLQWQSNNEKEGQVDKKVLETRGMDEAVCDEPPGLIPLARMQNEGGTKGSGRKWERHGG